MIPTLQLGQFGLWKPRTTVDTTLTPRRNLRAATVIAHDFQGDLDQDGRTGLNLSGTVSYDTGPAGQANGSVASGSTSVRLLQSSPLGLNCSSTEQPFFVSMWVRRRVTPTRILWSVFDGTATRRIAITHDDTGSDTLQILYSNQTISLSPTIPLDTWQHIVLAYDGTDFNTYRDGTLADTTARTATNALTFTRWAIGTASGTLPTSLGFDVAYFVYGHGSIGQDEVTYLYNNGAGRPASDWMTVAYGTTFDAYVATWSGVRRWALNNTTAEAGGGAAVTMTNGCAFSNAVALPSGLSGTYAALGDGTNDFVDFPNHDLTSTNELTVFGFWRGNGAMTNADRLWQFGPTSNSETNARGVLAVTATNTLRYGCYATALGSFRTVDAPSGYFPTDTWQCVSYISNATTDKLWGLADGYVVARFDGTITPAATNNDENGVLARAASGGVALNAYACEIITKVGVIPIVDMCKARDLANGSG